jgi:hypothetical protein
MTDKDKPVASPVPHGGSHAPALPPEAYLTEQEKAAIAQQEAAADGKKETK